MTIIFGNVVRSNWLLYIVLLYFWGQRIWGEEVHFGDVPFKNFISFQKGNLLIYIILILIFFVFTSEMTSLLSSILWSSPNLVPTAPPPIFTEKPWGRGWSSPSRGVEGWGGGGVYATRSRLCVRHFVSWFKTTCHRKRDWRNNNRAWADLGVGPRGGGLSNWQVSRSPLSEFSGSARHISWNIDGRQVQI